MRWRTSRSTAANGSLTTLSLLLLFIFVSAVAAQDNGLTDLPNLKTATSLGDATTATSATSKPTQSTDDNDSKTTSAPTTTKTTDATSKTTASDKTVTNTDITLTGGIDMTSSTTSTSSGKSASKETGSTSVFHLSDLPTVAGASIPTQIVPYTAGAPFMQKSNLPEGTVFIIVGAILGFFGLCVLAWRGLVAWSLSRSVKRAALAQHQTFDLKSTAYPGAGMYSAPGGSTASMERLSAVFPSKSAKRRSHHQTSSTTNLTGGVPSMPSGLTTRSSTQNLFFSPTAGAGHPSTNPSPHTPGNRGSAYLPAGYYASGTSQPAGGAGSTHINAHAAGARGSSILNPLSDRLSGIRAENAGYQRTQSFAGPSPPGTPMLSPTPGSGHRGMSPGNASSVAGNVGQGLYSQPSQSSLNLSIPGGTANGGRTPSAYLEDLFEEHGNGPRERF